MDAWMDRVTGFPRLQKADSQAPVPGVSLNQRLCTAEALVGRPAACKTPRTSPGPARPLGPRLGRANQKQHSTQERYTHISLTLSQVTQSRTERNKNTEVSESTAQAGAGPPRWVAGRWADDPAVRKESCSARVPGSTREGRGDPPGCGPLGRLLRLGCPGPLCRGRGA